MKKMKRLLAVLLTVVMMMGLATTVFADDTTNTTTYSITIVNEEAGHTYGAYQVFAGDLDHEKILSNIKWGEGVDGDAIQTALSMDSASAIAVALEDGELDVDVFAALVSEHLTNKHLHSGTQTADGKYVISGLAAGYYFIKDKDNSLDGVDNVSYTKFMLKVVKDTDAYPKTAKTTAEKKVYENVKPATDGMTGKAGNNYNDVADYNIGDDVPYAFYSKVPDMSNFDSYTFVFEDKLSAGLTFNNDVTVMIGNTTLDKSQYSVNTSPSDGCSFHVTINDLKQIAAAVEGALVRVDFTAELNASAVIGLNGNENEMRLKFSNNPNDNTSFGTTVWDKVVVFTYELDVTKVDGEEPTETLEGATFILYRENGDTTEYVKVDSNSRVTGWTTVESEASALVSDANGLFKVIGLDDGTYYLKETDPPAGYNILAQPITLVIKATTVNDQNWVGKTASEALTALTIKVDSEAEAKGDTDTGIVSATVENNIGATLPETGGVGTTLFYVIGGILVLGAVVVLITRKRMSNE